MKFFDERVGRDRYRHKGSGVAGNTLMAIGKVFTSGVKSVAKTAAKVATEKADQKLGEKAAEKGSHMIQKILRNRTASPPKASAAKLNQILENNLPPQAKRPASQDVMNKLNRIFANQLFLHNNIQHVQNATL